MSARARLVVVILLALAVVSLVFALTSAGDELDRLVALGPARYSISAILVTFAALELGLFLWFGRLERAGRPAPARLYLGLTVLEASVPTTIILASTEVISAVDALLAPPAAAYFLFLVLAPLRLDPRLCLLTGVVSAVGYFGAAAALLPELRATLGGGASTHFLPHLGRSVVMLACGGLAAFVSRDLRRRFDLELSIERDRARVVRMFGQHVSPAVVERLLEQEALPSETRHVCMMFLDIRGFTTFSERRTPDEVVTYLNALFQPLIEVVGAHHGVINKFLGDGFMAVFGAPVSDGGDSANALAAAREILRVTDALVAAGAIAPTRLGIGLHAGPATTGHVGSSRSR